MVKNKSRFKRKRNRAESKDFRPVANEAFHQAMVELRRSSASSPHTMKKHKGTRKNQKDRDIKEQFS